VQLGNSHYMVH